VNSLPAPVLLDLSHTSHTRARTGIQRVTRSLFAALESETVGITFDPYLDAWRPLVGWEIANLEATEPASKRGVRWPWSAKLRGRAKRLLGAKSRVDLPRNASGLIVPELFSPTVSAAWPRLFTIIRGPRVALFHDAIALKLPELTPTKTVARFPSYLRELLAFDGIAAVSEDSRSALVDYWRWLEVSDCPPVVTIPLGIDVPPIAAAPTRAQAAAITPVILSVGSIEGRKNHIALLEACDELCSKGLRFELRLIGLAHSQTGSAALSKIRALQTAGRSLRYDGAVDDAAVAAAYDDCTFTVYPSLMEGFGLPVLESLSHGKPCICSVRGALGEAARGGGCLTLSNVDGAALTTSIENLLSTPSEVARLAIEARTRKQRTWADYGISLSAWMSTLRRRTA
jgi:glycosyltransferase involved in cell wall biosynthesis